MHINSQHWFSRALREHSPVKRLGVTWEKGEQMLRCYLSLFHVWLLAKGGQALFLVYILLFPPFLKNFLWKQYHKLKTFSWSNKSSNSKFLTLRNIRTYSSDKPTILVVWLLANIYQGLPLCKTCCKALLHILSCAILATVVWGSRYSYIVFVGDS